MKIAPAAALHLLHGQHYATLATHAEQLPGYPYATVLPYVLDEQQRPLLLISALAEHTRNLLADGRCSLSVLEAAARDVQAAARLTLLADAVRIEPDALLRQRFLRYQPAAAQLLQLDFMFFRLQPIRLRYIGGVGRMGWLEAAALAEVCLPLQQEADWLAQACVPDGVCLLGMDAGGVDYRLNDEVRHRRQPWPDGLKLEAELGAVRQALLAGLGSDLA